MLEKIADAVTTTDVHDTSNTTHTSDAWFALENMPSDFNTMTTLYLRVQYARQTGTYTNTWNAIRARVWNAAGDTVLAEGSGGNPETIVTGPITTTTPTNSSVVQFTTVTAGDKTTWDGAQVVIRFDITKNMGGDSLEERVFAAEITGTYAPVAATNAPAENAAGTGTAYVAGKTIAANAGNAAGTGTAYVAGKTIAANIGNAAGTGTAEDATVTTQKLADAIPAAGTGVSYDVDAVAVAPVLPVVSGTSTAYDATAIAGNSADAENAAGTGTAYVAGKTIAAVAAVSTATGSALDADATGEAFINKVATGGFIYVHFV